MAEQQAKQQEGDAPRKLYGTFEGVFVPTLLTILGVIMYLRLGWVVGNAGMIGGALIILGAFAITGATGLSLAAITTNIRIGAGGAFSVISHSLGLEAGGSIGMPLYLSQALATTIYIFGFRTGWLFIFPEHPALIVDLVVFGVLFFISWVGPGLAFRVQYFILAAVVFSLVMVAVAAFTGSMDEPVTWFGNYAGAPENDFQGTSFWPVFAVFFPATTGIMAGANLSGDLREPGRSIPIGTLSAIVVSVFVYLTLAYWLARSATPQELVSDYTIMVERAAWGPAVLAGLLGATFSSAMASMVGAPRILQALASFGVVPGSKWLARHPEGSDQPRYAIVLSGIIILGGLMLRNLNAVAPLITMFFLITYMTINVVVWVEQQLRLVSFRPALNVPNFVAPLGTVGCLLAMFIINPVYGLAAVAFVVGSYLVLSRREIEAPFPDIRSGMFTALAEWAAKRASSAPGSDVRVWKPNLLVPVERIDDVERIHRLIHALVVPEGSIKLLGFSNDGHDSAMAGRLANYAEHFHDANVVTTWNVVSAESMEEGVLSTVQALRGTILPPNSVLLPITEDHEHDASLVRLIQDCREEGLGVLLFAERDPTPFKNVQSLNLWVRGPHPDWETDEHLEHVDLAVLIAYKLRRSWDANLELVTAVDNGDMETARDYMQALIEAARLPAKPEKQVVNKPFEAALREVSAADVNLFGLKTEPDLTRMRRLADLVDGDCLFMLDSGEESAQA
ncbi:MAG: amino acid permease [Egibacteraceae bacterium]